MTQRKIAIKQSDAETAIQSIKLSLAAMYLEETLNGGSTIEIPSLGVTLSREQTSVQKTQEGLTRNPNRVGCDK